MSRRVPIFVRGAFAIFALVIITPGLRVLHAQPVPRTTVRGRVLDDSTNSPLPLANVFVSNSTLGTAADKDGKFELKGVPLGIQQIVASIVGYQPGSITLNLTDTLAIRIELRLKPRPVQLSTVEVEAKDPVEWKANLERFIKGFFGSTTDAEKCKMLNPQVLDFSVDEETGQFNATAREPLHIVNAALGYKFDCILQLFSETQQTFRYVGMTAFQALEAQDKEVAKEWTTNRKNAYYGSRRHFLTSLVNKKARQEGFEVHSIRSEWIRQALERSMGFDVNPDTLLAPSDAPFEKRLSFPDQLQIVYTRSRPYLYSVIELSGPAVMVFTSGILVDPLGLWVYGYWSSQRMAEMLPIDYEPD